MEGLGIFGLLLIILGICITVAPLLIWRNGNRTNRLLALMLIRQGVPANVVNEAYDASGSSLGGVPGSGVGLAAMAKQAAENFKEASAPDEKPVPVQPIARFCHRCGTDAPLDAISCPTCSHDLAAKPLYCPKCGHEISHRPPKCPGCRVGLKWREAAS